MQQLHYTHQQVSLLVSSNTTLVPSLGLHIGRAYQAASALACKGSISHPKRERTYVLSVQNIDKAVITYSHETANC